MANSRRACDGLDVRRARRRSSAASWSVRVMLTALPIRVSRTWNRLVRKSESYFQPEGNRGEMSRDLRRLVVRRETDKE